MSIIDIETFNFDKKVKAFKRLARMRNAGPEESAIAAYVDMAKPVFPLEEIRQLPVDRARKNEILRELVADPASLFEGRLFEVYNAIKDAGGTINPERFEKLEVLLASHITEENAAVPIMELSEELSHYKTFCSKVGLDFDRVTKLASNKAYADEEFTRIFPTVAEAVKADEAAKAAAEAATKTTKSATEAAEAAKPNEAAAAEAAKPAAAATKPAASAATSSSSSSAGGGYSSSTSTPLSHVTSERKWYQTLTHDAAGKFSGKRAAIAAGATAVVAGGAYLLTRDNEDTSWQNKTTNDDRSAAATR